MANKKAKEKRLTKSQLYGLRSYRTAMVYVLAVISFISLWFKILKTWTFNDIMIEMVTLFIIFFMGIYANINNDFPIFKSRKLSFGKEMAYSITAFFSLLFLFIIYQNMIDPEFVSYVASLSLHDLFGVLVFLLPLGFLIILLIYFSFRCIDGNIFSKKKKMEVYSLDVERSLNRYKVLTVKAITILMLLSIWAKIGLNSNFMFTSCFTEILSVFAVFTLFVVGNIDNKLKPLRNSHIVIDKYFFISILLPYILVCIYAIFSSDFRLAVSAISLKSLISLLVYVSPLFLFASLLFYIGSHDSSVLKNSVGKLFSNTNKTRFNSFISIIITIAILIGFLYYSFNTILTSYTLENVLQVLLVFLPLALIIYLVILSGVNEINK